MTCKKCKTKTTTKWYKGLRLCSSCYNKRIAPRADKKRCTVCKIKSSKSWHIFKTKIHCRRCYKKLDSVRKSEGARLTAWKKTLPGKYAEGRKKAKLRGLEFSIPFEIYQNLLNNFGCFYCGKDVKTDFGLSLDRIDNSKGYLPNNVLTCCRDCNRIRGEVLTVDEMKFVMTQLILFRGNNEIDWTSGAKR